MRTKYWIIIGVAAVLTLSVLMEVRKCGKFNAGTWEGTGTGGYIPARDNPVGPETPPPVALEPEDNPAGPSSSDVESEDKREIRGIYTLEQAVTLINENLPIEITGDLRYDSVLIEDGTVYHHYYTYTGPAAAFDSRLEQTAGQSLERLRSMDASSPIKYTGLSFVFTYLNTVGETVHETVITPDMYR